MYFLNTQGDIQDKDLTDKGKRIHRICKVSKGKLRMSITDKPKSKNQKYIAIKECALK